MVNERVEQMKRQQFISLDSQFINLFQYPIGQHILYFQPKKYRPGHYILMYWANFDTPQFLFNKKFLEIFYNVSGTPMLRNDYFHGFF